MPRPTVAPASDQDLDLRLVAERLHGLGFEPGWGRTVGRIRDTLGLLQDLVRAAVNDALVRSREMAASEMAKIAGGMLPPGIL